jgi:glycine C-acetyltransferase
LQLLKIKIITLHIMVKDLFERIQNKGPLEMGFTSWRVFCFFKIRRWVGTKNAVWWKRYFELSLNDYLGLANHPVRQADTDAAIQYGAAYPMGATNDERTY